MYGCSVIGAESMPGKKYLTRDVAVARDVHKF